MTKATLATIVGNYSHIRSETPSLSFAMLQKEARPGIQMLREELRVNEERNVRPSISGIVCLRSDYSLSWFSIVVNSLRGD